MPRLDTRLESEGAEFLVLGQLLVERIAAYKTYTNMPGYDLVATNPDQNTAARIQVKSRWRTNAPGFPIKNFGCDFVVFCRLNRGTKKGTGTVRPPEYYVFPVAVVRSVWNPDDPWGKVMLRRINGWEQYRDRWDLIRQFLASEIRMSPQVPVEIVPGSAPTQPPPVPTGRGAEIPIAEFRRQAEMLDGQRLRTLREKRGFTIHVSPKGLTFTPASSGKPRQTTWKRIERVLDRYNETRSIQPVDYHDITRHSSYLVAVLHHLVSPTSDGNSFV